jgi:hypothetical protein
MFLAEGRRKQTLYYLRPHDPRGQTEQHPSEQARCGGKTAAHSNAFYVVGRLKTWRAGGG